jgi:hypothetical protein
MNRQTSDDGIKENNGPGDVSFIVNNDLLNTRKADKHQNRISHQLWAGGGPKTTYRKV